MLRRTNLVMSKRTVLKKVQTEGGSVVINGEIEKFNISVFALIHWESTKYRGPQIMICSVKKMEVL